MVIARHFGPKADTHPCVNGSPDACAAAGNFGVIFFFFAFLFKRKMCVVNIKLYFYL